LVLFSPHLCSNGDEHKMNAALNAKNVGRDFAAPVQCGNLGQTLGQAQAVG